MSLWQPGQSASGAAAPPAVPAPLTTDTYLAGLDPNAFKTGANAGVDFRGTFDALKQMGATDAQIQFFAPWMAANFVDPAGQFGKYAKPETLVGNLQKYLQANGMKDGSLAPQTTDPTTFGADAGAGSWLTHNLGDVLHYANPLDIVTGGAVNRAMGHVGNYVYGHTFGELGGWTGEHIFGDSGALANFGRFSAGGLSPGAAYEGAIQRGATPEQASAIVGGDIATAAAIAGTALTAGAAAPLLGAATAAGGAALGAAMQGQDFEHALATTAIAGLSAGAGAGLTAGMSPWVAALANTGFGAARGAASAYVAGKNPWTGAAAGAAGGLIGSAVPGTGVVPSVARGVLTGAASSAINGGNGSDILGSAIAGGAGGGLGAATGSPAAGRLASGLIRQAIRSPQQPQQPPISPTAPAPVTTPLPSTSPWLPPGR